MAEQDGEDIEDGGGPGNGVGLGLGLGNGLGLGLGLGNGNGPSLPDAARGGRADDVLSGLFGDDTLLGGGGSDLIDGGEGNDLLLGDMEMVEQSGEDASPLVLDLDKLEGTSYYGNRASVGDYALYRDVATLADGTSVWGRLVLTGVSDRQMSVDLAATSDHEILLDGRGSGDTASFRLEFYSSKTGEPIALNGIATFNDLDRNWGRDVEAVTLDGDSFSAFGTSADTSIEITETGTGVRAAGTEQNDPDDQDAWFSAEFENRTHIEFTLESRSTQSGFTFSGNLIEDSVVTELVEGADTILGGVGRDTIYGEGGDDSLDGGDDDDSLSGGDGNDILIGGLGADVLHGDAGADEILGGAGNDLILGGLGADTLSGGDGDDYIDGGEGDDVLSTGLGRDTLVGGAGNDTLMNSDGDDSLDGGVGDDSLVASGGNDTLSGGEGDDTLEGGIDNDSLTGGEGNDLFIYAAGDGHDTITDFNFGNTGTLSDGDSTNNDSIDLSGFYDTIFELHADQADDDILNQSNTTTLSGRSVDYSDNTRFGPDDSLTFEGASADSSSFTAENTGVVCFAAGTLIRTPRGDVPVEYLRRGDLVTTRDNGPQALIWSAMRRLGPADLAAAPHLRPVEIAGGAFGNERALVVSPQHGVLLKIDGDEVLARAIHLARLKGGAVRQRKGCRSVTYCHLFFESHQIVFSNDLASESFFPGPRAIAGLSPPARRELALIFPALVDVTHPTAAERIYGATARAYSRTRMLPNHLCEFSPVI